MLDAGGRLDVSARGDGGTPLIAALFWGHREVAELLGREPGNLRVAAGLGDLELIRALAGTPQAGAHRGFYRPHGGFPAWQPSDDPQEVLDEALVWAAKADRVEALACLVELGARVESDPYRGTALLWAAANGRVGAIRALVELGADPNQRATFGGPTHGEGVTALHLAAQAGRREAVEALLEVGADPTLRDDLHGGDPAGWAEFGCNADLAALLRAGSERSAGEASCGQRSPKLAHFCDRFAHRRAVESAVRAAGAAPPGWGFGRVPRTFRALLRCRSSRCWATRGGSTRRRSRPPRRPSG